MPALRRRTALLAVLLLVAAVTSWLGARTPADAATRYLLTAFTNSSESNMYVYTSTDGVNFALLRSTAYTPPSGLVRDPSVIRHTDGRYYIVYTTNWESANFGVAVSSDLLSWTHLATVNVGVAGTRETWAPEWFVDSDGSLHVIVSLSSQPIANDNGFTPWEFRPTNSSLTSWSGGTQLRGIGPNYIDTFVVKTGSTYHAFAKNETTKFIEQATATSLLGPYTFVGTGNWAGWGGQVEGPALTRLDSGAWRIYLDGYASGRYFYSDSTNLTQWTPRTDLPGGLSGFVRHGTVLRETVTGGTGQALVGAQSGRCLDVAGGAPTNGSVAQIWDCTGAVNQQWTPTAAGELRVFGTGKCLDVFSHATGNGSPVGSWDCTGGANQRWRLNADGTITGIESGRCLDVTGAGTANGTRVIIWTCGGAANQSWTRR